MALFSSNHCDLVGMVHLEPLPGSPGWKGDLNEIEARAIQDSEALIAAGCEALIVENMGDRPYLNGSVYPETAAAMTRIVREIVRLGSPVGVQVLAGANHQALAIAFATGASFIRVEGFAYGHVADEGWMNACAAELLRVRANLGSSISVWADVQKKHASHAMTADLSLEELAHGAAFSGADVLIVTGARTGSSTSLEDLQAAALAGLPVAVGSGVTPKDAGLLSKYASALIVGSYCKRNGDWRNPVDPQRVRELWESIQD